MLILGVTNPNVAAEIRVLNTLIGAEQEPPSTLPALRIAHQAGKSSHHRCC